MTAVLEDNWRTRAKCLGMDPALFYPEFGDQADEPKKVCIGCPVQEECLGAALPSDLGVWGGLSERQRRRLKRNG